MAIVYLKNMCAIRYAINDINGLTFSPGSVRALDSEVVNKSTAIQSLLASGKFAIVTSSETASIPLSPQNNAIAVVSADPTPEPRTIMAEDGITQTQVMRQTNGATIIVKGSSIDNGSEVPLENHLADVLNTSEKAPAVAEAAPAQSVVAQSTPAQEIPEDLHTWFNMSLNQKKSTILSLKNIDRLTHIVDYDKDVRISKLIEQRLRELEGA